MGETPFPDQDKSGEGDRDTVRERRRRDFRIASASLIPAIYGNAALK
jgi:hypothetical protein